MLDVPLLHLPPVLSCGTAADVMTTSTTTTHLTKPPGGANTTTRTCSSMLQHAHSASISPGLLVVDGVHLRDALDLYFPQLSEEETPVLLQGLFECLETAFGVAFKHIILHECSATPGQPTALGKVMAAEPFHARIRTHQLKARSGAAVDPHTWEPVMVVDNTADNKGENTAEDTARTGGRYHHHHRHHQQHPQQRHETATLLVESGLDVALSLDLLRHTTSAHAHPHQVVVVLSSRTELTETLEVVAVKNAVYVVGLQKEVLGNPLAERVKGKITLDRLLASAAESLLWSRRRKQKYEEAMHARAEGYFCPRGSACDYLRGTAAFGRKSTSPAGNGGSSSISSSQTSPRPFTTSKLEHLTYFMHPCGGGRACRNVAPYHQAAFPHHNDAHNTRAVGGNTSPVHQLATITNITTTTQTKKQRQQQQQQQLPWLPTLVTPMPLRKARLSTYCGGDDNDESRPPAATLLSSAPPGWGEEREDWLEEAVRQDYYGVDNEETEAAGMAGSQPRQGKPYWWQPRRQGMGEEEEADARDHEQQHEVEDERDPVLFPMSL